MMKIMLMISVKLDMVLITTQKTEILIITLSHYAYQYDIYLVSLIINNTIFPKSCYSYYYHYHYSPDEKKIKAILLII